MKIEDIHPFDITIDKFETIQAYFSERLSWKVAQKIQILKPVQV